MTAQEQIYGAFLSVQSADASAVAFAPPFLGALMMQAADQRAESARLAAAVIAAAIDKAAGVGGSSRGSYGSGSGSGGGVAPAPLSPLSVLEDVKGALANPLGFLVNSLFSIFSSSPATLAPLIKFALPQAIEFSAAEGPGGRVLSADYDQSGGLRMFGGVAEPPAAAAGDGAAGDVGGPVVTAPPPAAQVFDAGFFMDHSQEIASAVRGAMLYEHPINDVIGDL